LLTFGNAKITIFLFLDVEEFELPPSKYNDELTKSCEKLEASLKRLQNSQDSSRNPADT